MVSFQALDWKTVALHVGVGMGAASFWRGAWYVLDDHLFPDQPGRSALASLLLGTAGMAASQGLMQKCEDMATQLQLKQQQAMKQHQQKQMQSSTGSFQSHASKVNSNSILTFTKNSPQQQMMMLRMARFGAVYTVALSVVLVWRGTWIGWDVLYERFHNHHILSAASIAHHHQHHQQHQTSHAASQSPSLQPQDNDANDESIILPLHQHSVSMVKSTDPGHLTQSGVASHVAAVLMLLGAGLFASVLAPPAAVSVIRDATVFAVKNTAVSTAPPAAAAATTMARCTATNTSTQAAPLTTYQGPATNLLAAFLSPNEMTSSSPSTSIHPRGSMSSPASQTHLPSSTATPTTTTSNTTIQPLLKPTTSYRLPNNNNATTTSFPVSGHLTETMKHRARMFSTTPPQSMLTIGAVHPVRSSTLWR